MATGGLTPDDDTEFCSLCLEPFQDPKFLPCYHTFCATCIENLARLHTPGPFPCPHCRRTTTLPQDGVCGLQENFYIKPKDRKVYCRVHHDEKLKYFCLDCEEVVCCECRLTSHIYHAANGIDSVITQKKADLIVDKGRLKRAVASLEQQLDTAQRQLQNVKHSTDPVEKTLREQHATVVRHADQLLAEGLAQLQTYKDSFPQRQDDVTRRQDNLQKINDMIKELDNVVTNGSAKDVVAVAKEMRNGRGREESLSQMTSSTAEDFPFPVHTTLTTEADIKKKMSAFIGTVTPSCLSTPEVTVADDATSCDRALDDDQEPHRFPYTNRQDRAQYDDQESVGLPYTDRQDRAQYDDQESVGLPYTDRQDRAQYDEQELVGLPYTDRQDRAQYDEQELVGLPYTDRQDRAQYDEQELVGLPYTDRLDRALYDYQESVGLPYTDRQDRALYDDQESVGLPTTDRLDRAIYDDQESVGLPTTDRLDRAL